MRFILLVILAVGLTASILLLRQNVLLAQKYSNAQQLEISLNANVVNIKTTSVNILGQEFELAPNAVVADNINLCSVIKLGIINNKITQANCE